MGCKNSKDANQAVKNTITIKGQKVQQEQSSSNVIQSPDNIIMPVVKHQTMYNIGTTINPSRFKNWSKTDVRMIKESKVENVIDSSNFNTSPNTNKLQGDLTSREFKKQKTSYKNGGDNNNNNEQIEIKNEFDRNHALHNEQIQQNSYRESGQNSLVENELPKITKEMYEEYIILVKKILNNAKELGSKLMNDLMINENAESNELQKLILSLLEIKTGLDDNIDELKAYRSRNNNINIGAGDDEAANNLIETIKLFSITIKKIKQFYDGYHKQIKSYTDFKFLACDLLEKCGVILPNQQRKANQFDLKFDDNLNPNANPKLNSNFDESINEEKKISDENAVKIFANGGYNSRNDHSVEQNDSNQVEKAQQVQFNFEKCWGSSMKPNGYANHQPQSDFFLSFRQENSQNELKLTVNKENQLESEVDKKAIHNGQERSSQQNTHENHENAHLEEDYPGQTNGQYSSKANAESYKVINTQDFLKENRKVSILKIRKLENMSSSHSNNSMNGMTSTDRKYDKLERLRLIKERDDIRFILTESSRYYNRGVEEYHRLKRALAYTENEYKIVKNEISILKKEINQIEYQNSTLETENMTLERTLNDLLMNERSLKEKNAHIIPKLIQASSTFDHRSLEIKHLEQDPTLIAITKRISETQKELDHMQKLYKTTSEQYQLAIDKAIKEKLETMQRETNQAIQKAKIENLSGKQQELALILPKHSRRVTFGCDPEIRTELLSEFSNGEPGRISIQTANANAGKQNLGSMIYSNAFGSSNALKANIQPNRSSGGREKDMGKSQESRGS